MSWIIVNEKGWVLGFYGSSAQIGYAPNQFPVVKGSLKAAEEMAKKYNGIVKEVCPQT